MRIAVFGTGALGCLFGSRLAALAQREPRLADVVLIGSWKEQIDALTTRGLTIGRPEGEEERIYLPATAQDDLVEPVDLALILVKAPDNERTAKRVRGLLEPDGWALTLQNGLGNPGALEAVLGKRVLPGVTYQAAALEGPGRLRHAAEGATWIAADGALKEKALASVRLLRQAGFEAHLTGALDSLSWGKLVANAAINPVTALAGVLNGALVVNDALASVGVAAGCEVAQVARARGLELPFADPEAEVLRVAEATALNRSSMLQDLESGRPTEIDAICGEVVKEADRLGLAVPVLDWLWKRVRRAEQGEAFARSELRTVAAIARRSRAATGDRRLVDSVGACK